MSFLVLIDFVMFEKELKEVILMNVYNGIMTGLTEVVEYERGNLKVKTRTVKIIPPPTYTREEIKGLRTRFMFSQRVFAEVLGVSPKTIEAWEAGRNHPDGSSSRMLQLLQKDPDLILREVGYYQLGLGGA